MNLKSTAKLTSIFLLVLTVLTTLFVLFNPVKAPDYNYTIEGDTVYVDIAGKGKITQTPHTLRDFTNHPEVNFTSHFATEQCFDFAFGFNTTKARATGALYFKPTFYNVTKSYTCPPPRWYNYTLNPKHFWCWGNRTIHDNETNETVNETFLAFEHDFETYDLTTNTAYWNETKYKEWHDISDKFSMINYNLLGMNKWYYVKNIIFQPGETKTIKPTIKIKPQLRENYGKYTILIKRCSDTLQEAYDSDNYVLIDPWWNTSWQYKQPINFSVSSGSTEQNYQVKLELDSSNVGANFNWSNECVDSNSSRIRFTNSSENSELDFWVETCDATAQTMTVWVEVAENITTTDQTLAYMYYGNTQAAPKSDINATFLYGDDYEDGTVGNMGFDDDKVGSTTITESGGELFIDMGTSSSDAGIMVTKDKLPSSMKFVVYNEFKSISGADSDQFAFAIINKTTQPSCGPSGSAGTDNVRLYHRPKDSHMYLQYWDTGGTKYWYDDDDNTWSTAWEGNTFYDSMTDKWAVYEFFSNGTHWWVNMSNITTGEVLASSSDSKIAWSDTRHDADNTWMFYGLWYDYAYYGDMKSKVTYIRKYHDPEPVYTLGAEESDPDGDTCTYSGSGNWNIKSSDNCTISNQNTIITGNLTLYGSGGTITISNTNITMHNYIQSCTDCKIVKIKPYRWIVTGG